MKLLMIILLFSTASLALADDLNLLGKGFRIIGEGADDVNGPRKYSVMIYWVPNGAIGNCIENNGQGDYTVYSPEGSTSQVVNFRCSVPIGNRFDIQRKIGTRIWRDISKYHWRMEKIPNNEDFAKFDFFGNLRRQNRDLILGYDQNPNIISYYQGAQESYPEKYPSIFFARIEFYCSTQDSNYAFCSENNLRDLAKRLSTVGRDQYVQTLGIIPK